MHIEGFDGRFMDDRWWGFFGWLLPALLIVLVVGLVVWAIMQSAPTTAPPPAGWLTPSPPARDPALEAARLRYAKGETSREEFLKISADLGGDAREAPPPGSEEASG